MQEPHFIAPAKAQDDIRMQEYQSRLLKGDDELIQCHSPSQSLPHRSVMEAMQLYRMPGATNPNPVESLNGSDGAVTKTHIFRFEISVTNPNTGIFGLMQFVSTKITTKSKDNKSSRWID
jgi:hypothetical protein